MGFGHYTAYAKNALTNLWYQFDDSRVSLIDKNQLKDTIVNQSAYNLFFRRRDWHKANMDEGVNFDKIAIRPDLSYIQGQGK